jgi:hypothetical protein
MNRVRVATTIGRGMWCKAIETPVAIIGPVSGAAALNVLTPAYPVGECGRIKLTFSAPLPQDTVFKLFGSRGEFIFSKEYLFTAPAGATELLCPANAAVDPLARIAFTRLGRVRSNVAPGVSVTVELLKWSAQPCQDGDAVLAGLYGLQNDRSALEGETVLLEQNGLFEGLGSGDASLGGTLVPADNGRARIKELADTACDILGTAAASFSDGMRAPINCALIGQ